MDAGEARVNLERFQVRPNSRGIKVLVSILKTVNPGSVTDSAVVDSIWEWVLFQLYWKMFIFAGTKGDLIK